MPVAIDGNDEQVREYEQKWLTESIPAPDGWTPLGAAADPNRRDDLIRRLRDMLDL